MRGESVRFLQTFRHDNPEIVDSMLATLDLSWGELINANDLDIPIPDLSSMGIRIENAGSQ